MSASGAPTQANTVLVIDDSPVMLEVTKAVLEDAGFRVITRSRASGAVSAILAVRPDIVLLDVNSPQVTGDMIAGILARTGSVLDTTVVLHSNLPIELLRLKAIAAGAHGYIVKTSDPAELVRQVRHWLRRGRAAGRRRTGDEVAQAFQGGPERLAPVSLSEPPVITALPVNDRGASAPPPRKHSGTLHVAISTALFVDDDPTVLAAYRREPELKDIKATFTQSGNEALDAILSSDPPDVVVCDIMLRDIGGMDIYRRALDQDSSWKHRFVFVTGAGEIPHVAEFLNGTESRVLLKPVDPKRLRAAIRYSATGARMFRRDRATHSND